MLLSRKQILNLSAAITALRGTVKVVRDKDGGAIVKDGSVQTELVPFNITIKARYAASRTLEHIRAICHAAEESRTAAFNAAVLTKTNRWLSADPKSPIPTELIPSDVEYGPFNKEASDFYKVEEEVTLHQFPITDLKLADNPDLSPEHLMNLLPMLTGEL